MILVAILIPWLSFFLRGKILSGFVCLILQITLIGWLPATIWAIVSINNQKADDRNEKMIKAMKKNEIYSKPVGNLSNEEKARLYDEKYGSR